MLPIKFRLNLTHGLGGDVVCRISRWPPWRLSWKSKWNDINNSESICRSHASHLVSIRHTVWEEVSFEEFQDDCHGGHPEYWNRKILAILNPYVAPMPPIKCQLNLTSTLAGDAIWRILRWLPWRPSWISEGNNLANLSLCVTVMPPIKVWLNLTVWEMSFDEF